MNAKKVCCLVTVTAMLFFGLPAVPFANVDRTPQLSQEELGLVFQNSKSTWKEKPDFLKYLDDQEMKETKGKAAHVIVGAVGGGVAGAVTAAANGSNVYYGAAIGALSGAYVASGVGAAVGIGVQLATAASFSLRATLGGYACGSACHSSRPQGGH